VNLCNLCNLRIPTGPSPGAAPLGLRRLFPTGWWFFELGFIALCLAYYYRRSRVEGGFGHRVGAIALVILVLHGVNSPWLAPP
jgi:hypothetical protein